MTQRTRRVNGVTLTRTPGGWVAPDGAIFKRVPTGRDCPGPHPGCPGEVSHDNVRWTCCPDGDDSEWDWYYRTLKDVVAGWQRGDV